MGYAEFEWLRRQLTKEISWIPTRQRRERITVTVSNGDSEILIAEHHMAGTKRGYLASIILKANSFTDATATLDIYVDGVKASSLTGELYTKSNYPSGFTNYRIGYTNRNYIPDYEDDFGSTDTIVYLKCPIMFKDLEIRTTPIGTDWANKTITANYMIDEVDT